MTKRLHSVALAAGLLTLSLGSLDARADLIELPTTLDTLLVGTGNFAVLTVPPATEADRFSDFTFGANAIPPTTPVLDPTQVGVSQFHLGIEDGISLSGAMFAPAGAIVDYGLSYLVTAPTGFSISDSFLSGTLGTFGGNGSVSIGETLFDADTGALLGTLEISSSPGGNSDTINFAGVTRILVQEDVILVGGSAGSSVVIINQGFSSAAVPEPSSALAVGFAALAGLGVWARRRRATHPKIASVKRP